MLLSVKQAAEYLGVSPWTIRKWSNEGNLKHTRNISNNRVYNTKDLDEYYEQRTGKKLHPEIAKSKYFYLRSSNGNDVLLNTQEKLLTEAYGEPTRTFKDKASGLNENRKGLNNLLTTILNDDTPATVYVTSKDRLTRFGYNYLKTIIEHKKGNIVVLNDEKAKEPQEVLMEDFMSLIASFSGKFYRLRGYKQQEQLLKTATEKVRGK